MAILTKRFDDFTLSTDGKDVILLGYKESGGPFRFPINNLLNILGDLPSLTTTEKSNIVAAINELKEAFSNDNATKTWVNNQGFTKVGQDIFHGSLLISDTPTNDGMYIPTEDGPYPNAGGLINAPTGADEGYIVLFLLSAGIWSKSRIYVGIGSDTKIEDWESKTYVKDEVVTVGNKIYRAKTTTSQEAEEGASDWEMIGGGNDDGDYVTEEFLEAPGKNLYDGIPVMGIQIGTTSLSVASSPDTYIAVVKIKDGETYTATKWGANQYFLALTEEYPVLEDLPIPVLKYFTQTGGGTKSASITNDVGAKYLLFQYARNVDVEGVQVQIEKGATQTDYEDYYVDSRYLKSIFPNVVNMYTMPHGIGNSIELNEDGEFVYISRVREYKIRPSDIIGATTTSNSNLDYIRITKPSDVIDAGNRSKHKTAFVISGMEDKNSYRAVNSVEDIGMYNATLNNTQIFFGVPKGTAGAELQNYKDDLIGRSLFYQIEEQPPVVFGNALIRDHVEIIKSVVSDNKSKNLYKKLGLNFGELIDITDETQWDEGIAVDESNTIGKWEEDKTISDAKIASTKTTFNLRKNTRIKITKNSEYFIRYRVYNKVYDTFPVVSGWLTDNTITLEYEYDAYIGLEIKRVNNADIVIRDLVPEINMTYDFKGSDEGGGGSAPVEELELNTQLAKRGLSFPQIIDVHDIANWEIGVEVKRPTTGSWASDKGSALSTSMRTVNTFTLKAGLPLLINLAAGFSVRYYVYKGGFDMNRFDSGPLSYSDNPIMLQYDEDVEIGLQMISSNGDWEFVAKQLTVSYNIFSDNIKDLVFTYNKMRPAMEEYLAKIVQKIATDAADTNFRVGFITDTHHIIEQDSRRNHNYLQAKALRDLTDLQKIDMILHGGDISYESDPDTSISDFNRVLLEMRKAKVPFGVTRGNHDDYQAPLHLDNDLFGKIFSPEEDGRVYGNNRTYWYKDFDEAKVRVICLNSYDDVGIINAVFRQDQVDWIANTALDFTGKTGYAYMMFSHTGINDVGSPGRSAQNGDIIEQIMVARRDKTTYTSPSASGPLGVNISVNYTSANTVDCIAYINGHMHADHLGKSNGFNFMCTNAARHSDKLSPCFDVLCINTTTKSVKVKRFGKRGVDRSFTY